MKMKQEVKTKMHGDKIREMFGLSADATHNELMDAMDTSLDDIVGQLKVEMLDRPGDRKENDEPERL